jgi:hypothetical protein
MAGDDDTKEPQAQGPSEAELPESGEGYPPIDFNTFLLSLSTSALMSLGEVKDPATGEVQVNFPLARQTIDLLSLLEEKTQGNLTGEEERLLSQVLYDLRMRYMAAVEK